jgi:dipeptidase E
MKIIAIGGGEIGRPGTKIETKAIDKEIIRLTGKKHPKVLFIPTASSDSESYYSIFSKYYKKLGCNTDVLYLTKKPEKSEIENKIMGSDAVYVGGGNTLKMLKLWRKTGTDRIIEKAAEKGKVMSGVSAGAICWFKYGNSDSKLKTTGNLIRIKGLDFFDILVCPHYHSEKIRKPALKKMVKKYGGISIALDNCSAIEVVDDKYRIITSNKKANAYKVYRRNGKIIEEKLIKDYFIRPLSELGAK